MRTTWEMICRVDDLGRVALPVEVRGALDLQGGDRVEMRVDGEKGEIHIKKAAERCRLCGSRKSLVGMRCGEFVCAACLAKFEP